MQEAGRRWERMPSSGESPLTAPAGGPGVGSRRTRGAEHQVPLPRASPHNEGLTLPLRPLLTMPDGLPEAQPCSLHSSVQKLRCFPAAWGREGASTGRRPARGTCMTRRPLDSATQRLHTQPSAQQPRRSTLRAHPCNLGQKHLLERAPQEVFQALQATSTQSLLYSLQIWVWFFFIILLKLQITVFILAYFGFGFSFFFFCKQNRSEL